MFFYFYIKTSFLCKLTSFIFHSFCGVFMLIVLRMLPEKHNLSIYSAYVIAWLPNAYLGKGNYLQVRLWFLNVFFFYLKSPIINLFFLLRFTFENDNAQNIAINFSATSTHPILVNIIHRIGGCRFLFTTSPKSTSFPLLST